MEPLRDSDVARTTHAMASRTQKSFGPQGKRGNGATRTPPLRTTNNDSNSHSRYSFMDTPVEMERSTFQPHNHFSSPTNSTIDESPISPRSAASIAHRGLPTYPQVPQAARASPMPAEKAQTYSPQEMHPAFFAPYEAEQNAQQPARYEAPAPPSSPGPIPIKTQGIQPRPTREQPITEFLPPPTAEIEEPKPNIGHQNNIYNPDSILGPNVDLASTHKPGQVSHPNSSMDPHWKNGLCEPDVICCLGLVCPCMVYGKTMYRLTRKAQKQDPTDLLGYESCNGSCGLMAVACGFQCMRAPFFLHLPHSSIIDCVTGILAAIHRTRIRKLYHIEGSFGTDCTNAICCCCCVIMQNEREVRDREEMIRRHAGPAAGANGGYLSPGTMTYAPPPR